MTNPILAGDSYKLSHRAQLPANTTFMYSHLTPRFVKYLKQKFPTMDDKVIVYGLQATIAMVTERWEKEFFQRDWDDIEKETLHVLTPFLGYTAEHISHFKDLHTLGYLPLKFKTLPEGSHVEVNLPVLTVQNTHPDYPWLTNFVEPSLLNTVYKPMTVATLSLELAQLRDKEWDLTVSDHTLKPFALHDFSYRGQAGHESASATISAYLLYTKGTDTMSAIEFAQKYYQAGQDIAGSISAYEHSTATLNIQLYRNVLDHYDKAMEEDSSLTLDEIYSSSDLGVSHKTYLFGMEAALRVRDALLRNKDSKLNIELAVGETFALARHLIDVYPEGLFAYVSDSYNYHRLIGAILPELKEVITSRNGKLVIRPDCYSSDTEVLTNRGFIFFKDLTINDLVAQVLDDGTYEFVTPLKIVNEQYKGKMYHFKDHHGKVDQLVTPNHRMIYKQINPTNHSLITEKVVFAEDMKNQGNYLNYFERSAKAQNKGKSLTPLERLNIAFQADGSYTTGCNNSIRFSFSKQRKIDRLATLLTESSIPFKIYNLADGKKEFNISLSKEKVLKDFSWVDISDLCSNWCSEFIEELKHWDSSIRSEGRFKYDTTTESCSKVVELIALSAGKGAFTSRSEDNRKEHFSEIFTTHIMDNNKCGGQSWSKEEVDYEGTIHCVQVPTGRLVVKRNKSIIVCGNSGNPVDVICGFGKPQEINGEGTVHELAFKAITEALKNNRKVLKINGNYYHVSNIHDEFTLKPINEVEAKGSIQKLWDIFGGTINDKGYQELDPHIGLVYGDGMNYERIAAIYAILRRQGFAASNVVLSGGAFMLANLTRDDLGLT